MQAPIAHTFHELTSIHSTNLYAMNLIHAGLAQHGEVFFAHAQVAGRGQRGRQWWSAPGQNIAMSVVLDTSKLATSQSFRLIATMALGVLDRLKLLHEGSWSIKWPNDLYINDRKAGGILIENIVKGGKWKWSVVGIGINMNQHTFPDHLPNPVSVRQLTGKGYQCGFEALQMAHALQNRWHQLMEQADWSQILEDYNAVLYGRGTTCRLKKDSAVIPCLVQRVNDQGQLVGGENEEWCFDFGEVQWLLGI